MKKTRRTSERELHFQIVEEWQKSGATQKSFCEARHLNIHTFKSWLYKYRKSAETEDHAPLNLSSKCLPAFLPIVPDARKGSSGEVYRLHYPNGVFMEVAPETDAIRLHELIRLY